MLGTRLIQVAGVFSGVALTSWTFLYLLGLSMRYGEGLERATLVIPVIGLVVFLYACKRHTRAGCRWAFLEFFASSLVAYLIMQFVVVNLI
jgi:hypothetical protein